MFKPTLSCALFLFPILAFAADPIEQPKPLPTGALEEYDNPPAPLPLWGSGVSPGMHSTYGAFTSHQVNVNASGQNITGDAANESSITVDPTNHNRMSIGWRQFNSVTSNFRQGGYSYTTDGGNTWTFPGILENNVFRSDPVLIADDIGRFYYLSLLESFFDNVWRSVDSGQTYTNLGDATGGDKQWFTVDNTNSSGHGFQYQAWSTGGNNWGGRQFSRSLDGGVTWADPIFIPNSPQWGTLDVDSNGILFIGGQNINSGTFWCIRSSDAKNGAITPTFDQSTAVNMGGGLSFGGTINAGGLVGQVFLAVDRSGTATNNNVYMIASILPNGASNGSDAIFVRSTDGGQSFSAPKRINDDAVNQNKWHWMSTFGVAPNGRIDSIWLDTRNAANNTDSQLFYSYSFDGGVTWAPNVAVSNPYNPFIGYPQQNKMGDYMTIVSDNTGGDVAYCATFNNEEDVYYVRVSPTAPTPTPPPSPTPSPTLPPTPSPTVSPTPTISPTPSPSPVLTATPTATPSPTPTGSPGVTPTPSATATPIPPSQALNLSTRMLIQTGNNVGIGGFIITGPGIARKHVVIRAIGPSLTAVSDRLADPILELHGPDSFTTVTNDNWMDDPAQAAALTKDQLAPSNNLEAAVDLNLTPGAYTAVVRGKSNGAGVGLVEVYDLGQMADLKLANISTRAFVGTGSDIVVGGFILGNQAGNDKVIIRGIGPSLGPAGITSPLADPRLELRDSSGSLLMSNNDWQDDAAQAAELTDAGLALPNSLESGLVASLGPGSYTVLLSGTNNGTGVGLVEIYDRGTAAAAGAPKPTRNPK